MPAPEQTVSAKQDEEREPKLPAREGAVSRRDPGGRRGRSVRVCLLVLALVGLGILHLAPGSLAPWRLSFDRGPDSREFMWRILWGVHALLNDPLGLMNANTLYPDEGTYATMDYAVGVSILAAPIRLFTPNPLVVYNLTAFLILAISAWGAYLLAFTLTRSRPAAFVAAAIFAFNPIHLARIGQLNVLAAHWIPFVLYALHRLWEKPSARRAAALCLFLLLCVITGGHQAVFGATALGWGVVVLAFRGDERRSKALAWTGAAIVLAGLLAMPVLGPYASGAGSGERVRTLQDVARYSAPPKELAYLDSVAHGYLRRLFDPDDSLKKNAKSMLFPGALAGSLAGYGVWALARRRGSRHRLLLYGGLAALGFLLSLGVNLPGYGFLFRWVLPLQMIRAPARFSIVGLLGISVLAAFATARLSDRVRARFQSGAAVPLLCAAIGLLHLAESFQPVGWDHLRYDPPPPVYRWLADQPGDFAIAELPASARFNTCYLIYSTYHWKRLVNGFTASFLTPYHYNLFDSILPSFPAPKALDALEEILGLRYVVAHFDPRPPSYPPPRNRSERLAGLLGVLAETPPRLREVWRAEGDAVLELVEPPDGYRSRSLTRVAPGDLLRSRVLAFEVRSLEGGAHVGETGIRVFLNDREILHQRTTDSFLPVRARIPDDAVRRGINFLELRSAFVPEASDELRARRFEVGETGLSVPVGIYVGSAGLRSGNRVSLRVDGIEHSAPFEGYTLVVIDPETGEIRDRASFATWNGEEESERMVAYIEGLPDGALVALASSFHGARGLTDAALHALGKLGSSLDPRIGPAVAHVLIGVKGARPGSVPERASSSDAAEVGVGLEAIGRTGARPPAWVTVESGRASTPGRVSIRVNGHQEALGRTGYNVVVLDPETTEVMDRQSFRTARDEEDAGRMAAYLEGLPKGTIVALASREHPERSSTDALDRAFENLGAAPNRWRGGAGTYALIGVKGAAPGSAVEQAERHDSARVEVGYRDLIPELAARGIRIVDRER